MAEDSTDHSLYEKESEDDSGIEISWDGESDKANPMNWSTKRKVAIVGLVSVITFSTPFASDICAPAVPKIMTEFHNHSKALAGFVVSIYSLGNAIGPIVFAPASEVWGRSIVFNVSNVLFVGFTIGCALSTSLPMLFVFRFLAGCAGAAPLAVGGGTIADMIPREQRGRYFAVFGVGPNLAPLIAPIIGGFLAERPGWRWTFWLVVIIHGVISILTVLLLRETYAPVILHAKKRKIQKETVSHNVHVKGAIKEPRASVFRRAFIRPTKMLFMSPIVFILALFQAVVYGYRYIMYTTLPIVFDEQYHFSSGTSGLAYLGSGIGASIALYTITAACDHCVVAFNKKHPDQPASPERRLIPMIWAAPLCPIGLVWYGWSAQEHTQWIVPILGTAVFMAGVTAASLPSNIYMVDAFTEFAASGLAASFFLRAIAGGVLPLAGGPLYDALGVGWGASVLALVALIMCAFPPLIYKYGTVLRQRFPVSL